MNLSFVASALFLSALLALADVQNGGHSATAPASSQPASSMPKAPAATTPQAGEAPIAFESEFAFALARAKKESKPLLIDFWTPECPYCARMQRQVYPQEAVKALAQGFVWARIDQNQPAGALLRSRFQGGPTPTYLIVSHDGKTIYYRASGTIPAAGFIHNLDLFTVSNERYQKIASDLKTRPGSIPELLLFAKGELMTGNIDSARQTLQRIAQQDASNASGLVDDALVLLGHLENGNMPGSPAAREAWMRVVTDFSSSDRAADAVYFIANWFKKNGRNDKALELWRLCKNYPQAVDMKAAKAIIDQP